MIWRSWATLLLCAMILFSPSLALARAGGGYSLGGGSSFMSQGSRGFQTYQPNGASPLQRSLTPQPNPGAPYGTQPDYGYGGYGYGHPFMSGLFGGFFGSWLGGMLFPHWGMGWGFGGMMGSVFSWLLLLGVVWFAFRLFAGRGIGSPYPTSSYGAAPYLGAGGFGGGMQPMFPAYGAARATTIGVNATDYQAFEEILKNVQTAWSRGDLAALRRYVTPEMLSYFSEQLAANQSQGVINHVDDVELLKGEVREAWDEGQLHYATALMHWRARDYTVASESKPGAGELVVGGDPQHASEASEMWTFARSPGGHWLLSAIQQV